jgi:hypothetical protein
MWFRSIVGSFKSSAASKSSRSKRRRQSPRRAGERLRLESLENRCLLTFMAPVDYAVGQGPRSVAAADFTNNGIQDLVTCDNVDSTVSLLVGNGDGTFQPARTFATGPNPWSVAVGDLTGNGNLDIVTANRSYSLYHRASVSVVLGNGDGSFQAPLTFTLPNMRSDVVSAAVGDMNHDGQPDLVVAGDASASPTDGVVDVLLGHGDGTFSLASTTGFNASWLESMKLGDINGDGNLDVAATVSSGSVGVAVLLGNGNGTLDPPSYFATGANPESLAVGDVNGDGKLDLATANYGTSAGDGGVLVLLGNGDGTFQPSANVPLPSVSSGGFTISAHHLQAVVMGDLNGDGKMDLAVSGRYSYTAPVTSYDYYGTPYTFYGTVTQDVVHVLLGNGDRTFMDAQTVPLNGANPFSITAGNFNGDAFPDLAVAEAWANTVSVLLNASDWSTTPPTASSFALSGFPSATQAGTPGNITVTALNADGTVDAGYTGTVRFSSSDGQAALPTYYTFTAADAGTHTFNATLKTAGTQSITATDTSSGTLTGSETGIAVTPAAASHFAVSAPASSTAGSAFSVTVTALDPYNNTAAGYAGTVHFTSSDGQTSLPGNFTFQSTDAGAHTFSGITLKTSGSQAVTATDTSTGSITGGATIAVRAAAASTLIVSGFPSPVTAGVAGSFTVTLKDAYGNVATAYTGAVQFTSSDAKAVLPANYTFTSGDAGKHTFSATLKTAGTQSLKATAGALIATDAGITVKPAAASQFVLSAPASVTAGVPFSLTIKVEDAYGNIVTGYVGTIHFTSTDSRAKLPANYTFTAGDNGVHTFTGLVLKKKGNDTITVADTKNSSVTGKSVVDVV